MSRILTALILFAGSIPMFSRLFDSQGVLQPVVVQFDPLDVVYSLINRGTLLLCCITLDGPRYKLPAPVQGLP